MSSSIVRMRIENAWGLYHVRRYRTIFLLLKSVTRTKDRQLEGFFEIIQRHSDYLPYRNDNVVRGTISTRFCQCSIRNVDLLVPRGSYLWVFAVVKVQNVKSKLRFVHPFPTGNLIHFYWVFLK